MHRLMLGRRIRAMYPCFPDLRSRLPKWAKRARHTIWKDPEQQCGQLPDSVDEIETGCDSPPCTSQHRERLRPDEKSQGNRRCLARAEACLGTIFPLHEVSSRCNQVGAATAAVPDRSPRKRALVFLNAATASIEDQYLISETRFLGFSPRHLSFLLGNSSWRRVPRSGNGG